MMNFEKISKEDKITLTKELEVFRAWHYFLYEMSRIEEQKSGELNYAYTNDRAYNAAYASGFKMALETVRNFTDRNVRINKGLISKAKEYFESVKQGGQDAA